MRFRAGKVFVFITCSIQFFMSITNFVGEQKLWEHFSQMHLRGYGPGSTTAEFNDGCKRGYSGS